MFRMGLLNCSRACIQPTTRFRIQSNIIDKLKLETQPVINEYVRSTSFFNKVSGDAILKSITSVSNAGRKRGRGQSVRKKTMFDIYRGRTLGTGRANIKWPGLNSSILQGGDVTAMEVLQPDPDFDEKRLKARGVTLRKRNVIHPLERGWSGKRLPGKWLGPPPPIGDETFDGFDSTVLEVKYLNLMTSKMGKVRSQQAYVVVGNKNGILGYGVAKAPDLKNAIRKAQRKACKKLFHYKLEDKSRLNHDFSYKYGKVTVVAKRSSEGYGLVCHRGIAACCSLLGIKDLYAKVYGSKNKTYAVKAFLLGLLDQKSYQKIADETKLHVVELRKERMNYPVLLASPSEVAEEKAHDFSFEKFIHDGKLLLEKYKKPFVGYHAGYAKYLKRMHYRRNHDQVKLQLLLDYDMYRSYLADVYPECKRVELKRTKELAESS